MNASLSLAAVATGQQPAAPLVAHIIYRFDIGGMENGIVNLINHMPPERYRHAIVCLTDHTDFRQRLRRGDVSCYALHKKSGKDPALYGRLWRLLRQLRPQIVHTRNLAALDSLVPAALAGVPCRVHGEHGRDTLDLDGTRRKYVLLRRALRPLAQRYIAVSRDLEGWLQQHIGVPSARLRHICNGVDTDRFRPAPVRAPLPAGGFDDPNLFVIGSVLRMQPVKDPLNLARAFVRLVTDAPTLRRRARLAMIGDGPLLPQVRNELTRAGLQDLAWLPGARDDVPDLLRAFDVFVLPSLAEGISNTILEAMATGLPVIATGVGGSTELVVDGETGALVPPADCAALAQALSRYVNDRSLTERHGRQSRARCEREFSLAAMVQRYVEVYDELLGMRNGAVPATGRG